MDKTEQREKMHSSWINQGIIVVAVLMGLFHLYTAYFGVLTAVWQRSIHLVFGLLIAYLVATSKAQQGWKRVYNLALSFIAIFVALYLIVEFDGIINRFGVPNNMDMVVGITLIVLVLDFARRITGNILPGIAVAFLFYALLGPYLPGILWHRGYDIPRIVNQISLSTEGIFGTPLGVSANYIYLFVLFGALLEITNIGQYYIDLAVKGMGKSPGGPAKAAVIASSLFGSVSGSAVANVAATGSITIPLMKSIGYEPEFAGAVEATASTGGQIMPPLMGASAFIMAEILGIPYYQVALGALIPALIFYGAVFSMVHFRAKVVGLKGTDTSYLPSIKHMVLAKGYMLLPVVVLIYFLLIAQISVMKAAVYSVIITVLIGIIASKTTFKDLVKAFDKAGRTVLVVTASTACAGIIVAVINLTGLGMKFSSLILGVAGGNLLAVLLVLVFASLLLGMGLPTTPAYLLLAVLGAPTLVRLGVDSLAAHMFVFYFGSISMITPPLALAVFAASSIADSKFWKTAGYACLLGVSAFIVPYLFVYNPALLMRGALIETLVAGVTGIIGAVVLGGGLMGWLLTKATVAERVILVAAGFAMISPENISNWVGLAGIIAVVLVQMKRKKRGDLLILQ